MKNNIDNDKRLMLEGLYITGNRFYYSNKVQKMMYDYLSDVNRHFKTRFFGDKHHTYYYRANSIVYVYETQLSLASVALIDAKKKANRVYKEYMDLKKEIMEAGAYADPEIRRIFNQKKAEWRDASMDVIKTKTALYSCEIEYNNIIEYVNLTTEYIKFLEQNQKDKV